jgi:hypothetical protein
LVEGDKKLGRGARGLVLAPALVSHVRTSRAVQSAGADTVAKRALFIRDIELAYDRDASRSTAPASALSSSPAQRRIHSGRSKETDGDPG